MRMIRQVRMFGAETEYAVTAIRAGAALERSHVVDAIMQAARRRLVHLPDLCSNGMFLENGSRFYVDCGLHPEMSTPECTDPWTLVSYIQAGNQIVTDLIDAVEAEFLPGSEVLCFRCNVDYSGGTTWGSHESYLHTIDPARLQPEIIPHIASRIIYAGAGGFHPRSPGLEFSLSPRAAHFRQVVSLDSTGTERGLYHAKNEPLCREGFNRLHIICGESLCSETAMLLKLGTTALIVALADNGIRPGAGVQLEAPLEALRTFAADPTCKKTTRSKTGKALTAIDIQRQYLLQVESHAHDFFMPDWTVDLCCIWRDILDRLDDDPRSTDRVLDWSLKFSLYADQATRNGLRWERLAFWNHILSCLDTALKQLRNLEVDLPIDVVIGPQSPVPEEVSRLTRFLQSKNLGWRELRHVVDARQRLFEIDTRFGQLGNKGIFNSVAAAGVLRHHIQHDDSAPSAVSEPPPVGRGRLRGHAIRRLAIETGAWRCDWQCIVNPVQGRMLDLGNPFATEESWTQSLDLETSRFSDRLRLLSRLEALRRRA